MSDIPAGPGARLLLDVVQRRLTTSLGAAATLSIDGDAVQVDRIDRTGRAVLALSGDDLTVELQGSDGEVLASAVFSRAFPDAVVAFVLESLR